MKIFFELWVYGFLAFWNQQVFLIWNTIQFRYTVNGFAQGDLDTWSGKTGIKPMTFLMACWSERNNQMHPITQSSQ